MEPAIFELKLRFSRDRLASRPGASKPGSPLSLLFYTLPGKLRDYEKRVSVVVLNSMHVAPFP